MTNRMFGCACELKLLPMKQLGIVCHRGQPRGERPQRAQAEPTHPCVAENHIDIPQVCRAPSWRCDAQNEARCVYYSRTSIRVMRPVSMSMNTTATARSSPFGLSAINSTMRMNSTNGTVCRFAWNTVDSVSRCVLMPQVGHSLKLTVPPSALGSESSPSVSSTARSTCSMTRKAARCRAAAAVRS